MLRLNHKQNVWLNYLIKIICEKLASKSINSMSDECRGRFTSDLVLITKVFNDGYYHTTQKFDLNRISSKWKYVILKDKQYDSE